MKKFIIYILQPIFLLFSQLANGQPPIAFNTGIIMLNDGRPVYRESNYTKTIDSVNNKLKLSPNDTTLLFYRSLFYLRSNDVLSKPYQTDPKALTDLNTAQALIEKALTLGMQDLKLKVLRAEVYASLCYRFGGDESWKFKPAEIAARRKRFNEDKRKANLYYEELTKLDSTNAYDYQRRLVKADYPVK